MVLPNFKRIKRKFTPLWDFVFFLPSLFYFSSGKSYSEVTGFRESLGLQLLDVRP